MSIHTARAVVAAMVRGTAARTRFAPIALSLLAFASTVHALPQLGSQAPIVIAHRGASGYMPEHTLAAYELAVKMGADYIEPDLQLTRDGHLVAMHDTSLARTTDVEAKLGPRNGNYNVSSYTLAEIKTLTVDIVPVSPNPGFVPVSQDAYRVPTFQEVIDVARGLSASSGREIGIYPEAKQADPVMEDKILQTLAANNLSGANKIYIQSFSADTIRSIQQKQTALGLDFDLFVLSTAPGALTLAQMADIATFADGVGGSISGTRGVSESFIQQAHGLGLLVHGYTFSKLGDAGIAEYDKFFNWGIDGVFSNNPDLAFAARDAFLVSELPEPGSSALAVLGLVAAGAVARRRRSQQRDAAGTSVAGLQGNAGCA
jgi:glycerophosphoryl diester phosphodiesterase